MLTNFSAPRSAGRIDCTTLVPGLRKTDCDYMSSIHIAGQGKNSLAPNNLIWVGSQGPNLFNFINESGRDMILLFWHYPVGDYAKLFMSAYPPQVSYSLAPGQTITLSVAHGISGGWGGLYDHKTILDPASGLLRNTWGEFTTTASGKIHVDVSRLVYMKGDNMSIRMDKKAGGCVSDFSRCFFECVGDVVTCGRQNEYRLVNCDAGSQEGANYGLLWDSLKVGVLGRVLCP